MSDAIDSDHGQASFAHIGKLPIRGEQNEIPDNLCGHCGGQHRRLPSALLGQGAVTMRFLLPVALAVVLLTGGAAHAYRTIGAGTDSCETWTADRRQPLGSGSLQDEQWVLGFLSGIGYEGEEVIDPLMGLDAQAVWAWVDDYCQAHPLEKIAAAAEAFSYEHPR